MTACPRPSGTTISWFLVASRSTSAAWLRATLYYIDFETLTSKSIKESRHPEIWPPTSRHHKAEPAQESESDSKLTEEEIKAKAEWVKGVVQQFRDKVGMGDKPYQEMLNMLRTLGIKGLPSKEKMGKFRRFLNSHLRAMINMMDTPSGKGAQGDLKSLVAARALEAYRQGNTNRSSSIQS